MSSSAWAQEQTPKVAVMPFVVRSPQDAAKVRQVLQEVLTRQLTEEGVNTIAPQEVNKATSPSRPPESEDVARSVGRGLGADYAIMGSFTQIGNSISIDAKVVHVPGQKKTEAFFGEETGLENLALATSEVSRQAAVYLLARSVIAEVQVRGNERIEAAAIKQNARSQAGELLRPEVVSEDIKSIYKMGYFEKVEAEVSETPAGKVLTFVVQENPTVEEVRFKGNKNISDKDLMAAITVKPFTVLQKAVLNEDVQKILGLYHEKGYFNAQVNTEIEFPRGPRKAVVLFAISEKGKVLIQDISFDGNEHFSDRKLRGVMQTKQKGILSRITDRGILRRDILDTDVDRLTVYYHDRGFMDAKVGAPDVSHRKDGIYITIPVEEGERYRVERVDIRGPSLEGKEDMEKKLKLGPSDYFSREKLREDIESLSKEYMNAGYAFVEINPDVKRNPQTHTTDIAFEVNRGPNVHIGHISITGNTKTRDKVIRREVELSEGETFSADELETSLFNLRKLDYFEDVQIVPTPRGEEESKLMDLNVKVKEKMTGSFTVGGGYSSNDGFFASGAISQRNFLGKGQFMALRAYFGQRAQRYVFSFTEPYLYDYPLSAGFDIYDWLREYNDFTKDSQGFRLRLGYPFGRWSRLSGYYTFENAEITDISDNASSIIRDQEGRQIKSSITMLVERDTTDHPFLPTRGSIERVSIEYATPYLGSDSDFLKYELEAGWYIPLFWKLIGSVHGEFGWITELDNDDPVPLYERFFLGGIDSLRGFDFADVGPKDENDEVIGGLKYVLANVELMFPLVEKLGMRGVVFFDAGNAYEGNESLDITNLRTDVGAGVRWNSPLGPLRVELGYNLDPEPGEDDYQWQFSAGALF